MFPFNAITFLSPWVLSALAVVPVLWWLLRVLPPRPRVVKFPAFFLLKDLKADIKSAARTPWWLLLLRSLVVIFFILALADPVEHLSDDLPGGGGSVLLTVDNGWSAAAGWRKRQSKIKEYLYQIRRSGRSVIVVPTAAVATDGGLRSYGPMDVAKAEKWVLRLQPQPWRADHVGLKEIISDVLDTNTVSHSVFLSDGSNVGGTWDLMEMMQTRGGGLTVVADDEVNNPYILKRVSQKPGDFSFKVMRMGTAQSSEALSLIAYTADGGVLDEFKFKFPLGATETEVTWEMLPDMKSKVGRVNLRRPVMASTTFLTDTRWRQHPVGIVADADSKDSRSFLNEVYYLRRALESNGALAIETPDDLLKNKLSAVIWPDSAPMAAADRVTLLEWVKNGGFLIRFAGPNLAANSDDPLLPVALRHGQRSMEGAMTWEKPVSLGGMPDESPLLGLALSKDVTVTRQILADPSPESFERTWLQLEDGTPLITGGNIGKGVIALIHTTAGPEWSSFCYSGLYVEALQRMVSLSTGIGNFKGQVILPPLMLMDGFGHLRVPEKNGIVLSVDPSKKFKPSPQTPPGLYGRAQQFQVYNLGAHLDVLQKLDKIPGAAGQVEYSLSGERHMKPDFFRWALLLLLVETLVTMGMRGIFVLPFRTAVVVMFMSLFAVTPAQAQGVNETDLASGIYLAYVETGDADIDEVSRNGLSGLANVLKTRTTINVKGVRAVHPETDKLFYYPFLYWPMASEQVALSPASARNLQSYMSAGGLIVFDTRDQQFGNTSAPTMGAQALRALTKHIHIPELKAVKGDHVLTRSFYLLDSFPGRFAGGEIWAEKEPDQRNDAVTTVIIGANDWASAWSDDPRDLARFDISPGGERQREMAYRVGVNITMMALAGNYKADQMHVPFILKRLGK